MSMQEILILEFRYKYFNVFMLFGMFIDEIKDFRKSGIFLII